LNRVLADRRRREKKNKLGDGPPALLLGGRYPFEFIEAPGKDVWEDLKLRPKDECMALTRKAVRFIYDDTQSELKKLGITHLNLARGVKVTHQGRKDLRSLTAPGTTVRMQTNALSSWTINPQVATEFAKGFGYRMEAKIPVERVFSTARTGIGSLGEGEFVILGGSDDVASVTAVYEAFFRID